MKLVWGLVVILTLFSVVNSAPPTCYSRVLTLNKEIMESLEKLQKYRRTKHCMEVLPKMYLDVHNSCVMTKLRDVMYILENLPTPQCREKPRIIGLKRKIRSLYTIINKVCYRDLVFFTDDCDALETGHSTPRQGEEQLQLLKER
ncbi:cytokine-like protein 1 [Acipenser oxyrinchus oxyrinchus]|uniref:Cytokine-like protein 1 n=1 Tax=Acipenser oxyrinchus oxyrinchus TaxID=40147 RepID=A0AAD8GIJ0_ACIOX|nr:cytokine-like protein 1 [Acipenser oxyrinchus oxyrinchus]